MSFKKSDAHQDNKASGVKRPEGDKDLQSKRIVMPPSLRTWLKLGLPQEMVDEQVFADISKQLLTEAQEQARELGFKELASQLGVAIQKTKNMVGGTEAKKKKDREITEAELVEIFKKPNFIAELDEIDPSKIKKDALRDKLTTYLSKRPPKQPAADTRDDWEKQFAAFYREEYLKTE